MHTINTSSISTTERRHTTSRPPTHLNGSEDKILLYVEIRFVERVLPSTVPEVEDHVAQKPAWSDIRRQQQSRSIEKAKSKHDETMRNTILQDDIIHTWYTAVPRIYDTRSGIIDKKVLVLGAGIGAAGAC